MLLVVDVNVQPMSASMFPWLALHYQYLLLCRQLMLRGLLLDFRMLPVFLVRQSVFLSRIARVSTATVALSCISRIIFGIVASFRVLRA